MQKFPSHETANTTPLSQAVSDLGKALNPTNITQFSSLKPGGALKAKNRHLNA